MFLVVRLLRVDSLAQRGESQRFLVHERLQGRLEPDALDAEDVTGRLRQSALQEAGQEDDGGHDVAVGQEFRH